MLREALESFEPRTPLRDADGKPTGEFAEATATVRDEHAAICENARAGHYAGKGDDLARDLEAVGAPGELVDAARNGEFDASQGAVRAREFGTDATPSADDDEPETQAQPEPPGSDAREAEAQRLRDERDGANANVSKREQQKIRASKPNKREAEGRGPAVPGSDALADHGAAPPASGDAEPAAPSSNE